MNRHIIYLLLILTIISCSKEDLSLLGLTNADTVEVEGVEAYIAGNTSTRAAALDAYNYVGRSAFIDKDKMVLTTIKRTENTIPGFNYSGIVYEHVIENQQTSGGWNRNPNEGYAHDSNGNPLSTHPERIYWSDSHNGHTYIGYSVPQQPTGTKAFDWKSKEDTYASSETKGIQVYYGSLGDPTQIQTTVEGVTTNYIDYKNTTGEQPTKDKPNDPNSALSYKSGNEKIQRDDILLTYDINKTAEIGGSVAKLSFHHGLAQVRVIVNIQGFSASSEAADASSVVSGMILKNMLTMYKWRQQSYAAEALDEEFDKTNINAIYNNDTDGTVTCGQKKDVHLWIPRPDGTGTGIGKQFTFYGLAVPRQMGIDQGTESEKEAQNLHFEFNVTYPDPMKPTTTTIKNYKAMMPGKIEFRAGHCTTINISLNHSNEQMTVGAEYMDWQMIETPDQGELKKNSTFLDTSDRTSVTILGDDKATEDDATWLHIDSDTKKIVDIYGNDGSASAPFKISTANQLLSFAYEVKGTDRKTQTTTTYKGLDNADHTLSDGFDFTGYYVTLDADITMQKSLEILHDNNGFYTLGAEDAHVNAQGVTWPGIGDATHKFNGVFNGGYRHINKLYGASFFNTIGENGIVDHIFITDAIEISGSGSIAEVNNGIICGSHVEGNIVDNTDVKYCGSIVGVNNGVLIACSHIGSIEGKAEILGALLGQNNGILVTCYNVGDAKNNRKIIKDGKEEPCPAYAGIGDFTAQSIAYCCYFNKDFYTSQDYADLKKEGTIGHVAFPLTTTDMQSNMYVNKEAVVNPQDNNTGEITDPYIKNDIFFYHWSLNEGLRRATQLLSTVYDANPNTSDNEYLYFHEVADKGGYLRIGLIKSQVKWLIDHFSKKRSDNTLEFTHQFQFIPGTYPKLK